MKIKHVGVLSLARMVAVLYAVLGFCVGAVISLLSMTGLFAKMSGADSGVPAFFGFGIGAVIILPIMYGVIGAIVAAIGAALYNALAGAVGPVEVQLE